MREGGGGGRGGVCEGLREIGKRLHPGDRDHSIIFHNSSKQRKYEANTGEGGGGGCDIAPNKRSPWENNRAQKQANSTKKRNR